MIQPENQAEALKPCPFCGSAAELRGISETEIRRTNDQCISAGAFNAYGHRNDAIEAWNRRASLPEAPAVPVVKALEWRNGYRDENVTIVQASFGGLYQVRTRRDGIWLDWPDRRASVQFDTLDAAKAAAQADFETRIRSAILSSPPVKAAAVDGDICRAAAALLNNLWGTTYSGIRTHDENWAEFERRYPGVKWLHDSLASQNAVEGEAVAPARCCSAISPCSWQRHHGMDSVCPTCVAATSPSKEERK
jgi:hypothetical protein